MRTIDKRNRRIKKVNPLFLLKAGIGSAAAILLAEVLGLSFSPSAGIITLLTLQNTKKETLMVAARRFLSFLLALLLALLVYQSLGYTSFAFGIFVLLFAGLCYLFQLVEGISMNAVLMTHFLIEKRMDFPLIINEGFLLLLGMGIGILINFIMPNYKKIIRMKQLVLEEEIKRMLRSLGSALKNKEEEAPLSAEKAGFHPDRQPGDGNSKLDFTPLDTLIEELINKAYEDAGNTLLSDTRYLIVYLEMRKLQVEVLKEIGDLIRQIPVLLKQAYPIAAFMERTAYCFHELNNVEGLLKELDQVFLHYKKEPLPADREEFEYRAVLFMILKQLEYFLVLKQNFVLELEQKNMKSYWSQ